MNAGTSRFDLVVAYRVYPEISKTPFIHTDDKFELTRTCLRSFCSALSGLRVKVLVLLDGCPSEYRSLFCEELPGVTLEFIELNSVGNMATFALQLDLLMKQQDAKAVCLAEDDYLYCPGAFKKILSFMESRDDVDFVSPYDHIDYYTMRLHALPTEVDVHEGIHFRTAGTTCLTFVTSREKLIQTAGVFLKYTRGMTDAALWLSLTKSGVFRPLHLLGLLRKEWFAFKLVGQSWLLSPRQTFLGRKRKLWVPTPSLATHAETTGLAPCVDWQVLATAGGL